MHRLYLMVLFIILEALPCAAQSQPPAPSPDRLLHVQALQNPMLSGSLPTYYTPGSEQRAKDLQLFIEGERQFYEDKLGIRINDLSLAVLGPEQWPKAVPKFPYGMPSVWGSPPVIVMPTRWEEVRILLIPKESDVDPALLRRATAQGKNWKQVMYKGADGIGAHELGHRITYTYGINAQTHWFNEFLASYAAYGYLKEKVPTDVAASEITNAAELTAPHPHTSLADFESMYLRLIQESPMNYGWYQCALFQRVIEVYGKKGVDFLKQVQKAFPRGAPPLTSDQVLDRLEEMDPGWKAWAKSVEAGKVTPAKSAAVHPKLNGEEPSAAGAAHERERQGNAAVSGLTWGAYQEFPIVMF